MMAIRSDAARSRERILTAAREQDSSTLRLNDLARETGLGVGTVYRHFPTVHALVEALAYDTLIRMRDLSREAAAEPDAEVALASFLRSALDLQLADGGLQAVLLSPDDETDDVRETKREIFATFTAVLERARSDGAVRADLTVEQLEHLICGIEHAVRLGSPADSEPFLQIMLAGIRP
ncbi:TetR/AcrR family transcriptional regulator [Glaciibacter superstes]|uniref:TetR/AcrR family transcriptional regulator n=1 Tax=Glaciibacter superstes TaxID=501023 RepID=UPI00047DF590|nr:TetR/AcrR family transcriptional regulator [Glaciibacter superstes]